MNPYLPIGRPKCENQHGVYNSAFEKSWYRIRIDHGHLPFSPGLSEAIVITKPFRISQAPYHLHGGIGSVAIRHPRQPSLRINACA
ncbi:hypothetical protein GQ44DRAFT_709494 [Phaeosphaeriaceae sp. PMI808]|nr:hypothetical protein GQ44DRAFT_709494 [Phaeosphaeriaceae sp. PMI808]